MVIRDSGSRASSEANLPERENVEAAPWNSYPLDMTEKIGSYKRW